MGQAARKILVADADEAFLAQVGECLRAEGLTPVTTANGFRANGMVDEEGFVGIVTSVKLASFNGLQIAESAKTSKLNAKTPVLVLAEATGDRNVEDRVARLAAAQLVVKPVSAEELARKLKAVIGEAPAPKSAQPAQNHAGVYDVRIMNAFIESMQEVFEFYLAKRAEMGKPSVKPTSQTTSFLSSTISFSGESAKGSMALTFERPLLIKLKAKMVPDAPPEVDDAMLADLAGEMANQVCGSLKRRLAALGLKVGIGLPKVIIGKDHKLIHVAKSPVVAIPAKIDGEPCGIEFCMMKNDDKPVEQKETDEMAGGDVLLF